jgi:hypothetical protein
MMRAVRIAGPLLAFCLMTRAAFAQQVDSIHVYQWVPDGKQNSGSAQALVWRLYHAHAEHRTLKGDALAAINEQMRDRTPSKHVPVALPDLAYVAMVFSNGRRIAFGLTADLDRLIDLTDMREFSISTWPDHEHIQAQLRDLLVVP